jgi:hypothetical protein
MEKIMVSKKKKKNFRHNYYFFQAFAKKTIKTSKHYITKQTKVSENLSSPLASPPPQSSVSLSSSPSLSHPTPKHLSTTTRR